MRRTIYKPGTFLYKLGNKGFNESDPNYLRVFIHSGYETADGYCVLLGYTSGSKNLCKSTGYGNYCYGNDVRLATENEIEEFIKSVHNYDDTIKNY